SSTGFSEKIEAVLPRKWVKRIERYSAHTQAIRALSTWQIVLRAYLTQIIIHSVVIVAIILLSAEYLLPLADEIAYGNLLVAFATLALLAPFLWALSLRRVATEQVQSLMAERKYRGPIIMMILF